jgi:hypothetical protein
MTCGAVAEPEIKTVAVFVVTSSDNKNDALPGEPECWSAFPPNSPVAISMARLVFGLE